MHPFEIKGHVLRLYKFMKSLYCIYILCVLFSCQTKNDALETALRLAGDNRLELEKVLRNYSLNPADSLKLRAAIFLIENMPGHYTLEGDIIDRYREKIYEDTTSSYFNKKMLEISLSSMDGMQDISRKVEDVEIVKADFLIRHIERSFECVNECPWLQNLPFHVFLEYILPYRFESERLDLWRDSVTLDPLALKELDNMGNVKYDMYGLGNNFALPDAQNHLTLQLSRKVLKQNIYSECLYKALQENVKSRVACIPSSIHIIPFYANRNGFHCWNKVESGEFKYIDFIGREERKTAKVYKKTFSHNRVPIPAQGEYIPEFFQNPFYKDVSNDYMYTADVTIPFRQGRRRSAHHAYLCVFNDLNWQPIVYGEVKDSHVKFERIGKKIVYLPVYYQREKMTPLDYPFILHLDGKMQYLEPDTNIRRKLHIVRKYPFNNNLLRYSRQARGIVIEASERVDFLWADTIGYNMVDSIVYIQNELKSTRDYRYWRISHPTHTDVADITFMDRQGNTIQGEGDSRYAAGFDKDPLTNISINRGNKIEVDFLKPVNLATIICLPRGDGNGIYLGNEYELFYYGFNGWVSLGRKSPSPYFMEYDNIPANALLWLHNHTSGKEERIFTIENDEVRFW